jgi:small subunit ribosomal protein S17
MAQGNFGGRKIREGTVVSEKMDKTVVVAVETRVRHPLYKKTVKRLHRHMAHDETNDAKLGDVVRIVESRPYSRHKRWRLAEVLIRAERPEVAARDIDLDLLGEVKVEKEEAAAPAEAVAEAAPPEVEAETPVEAPAEAPAEAAEEVPPVEQVVTEAEATDTQEAAVAAEPETEVEAKVEETPEAAAAEPEAEVEAKVEEAPETAAAEPEAATEEAPEAEAQPEEAPEAKAEEAAEAAIEEPEGEEKEGSS